MSARHLAGFALLLVAGLGCVGGWIWGGISLWQNRLDSSDAGLGFAMWCVLTLVGIGTTGWLLLDSDGGSDS